MEAVTDFIFNNAQQIIGSIIAVLLAYFGIRFQERARLQQYFGELRVWASNALDDLSEAAHLCLLDPALTKEPTFYNRRQSLLVKLSSRIDQGRLFFPNTQQLQTKQWQLTAVEQLHQRPLDALIYAYGAVKQMSYQDKVDNDHLWEPLIETKREFTSSTQLLLDPRQKGKQFDLAMKKTRE